MTSGTLVLTQAFPTLQHSTVEEDRTGMSCVDRNPVTKQLTVGH